ncbi:CalY family protein [Sutcliffiella horikoshii]|uniref:CalY family protein n=1 Tax=Sutcliffiella horikoshii TaxID=79883 RepID=UPI001F1EFC02|nr:CalY family protein [Sutcliffiella horikoshii]MCG1021659.1 hypothetical protein [Sutcliffiella horikoshii]
MRTLKLLTILLTFVSFFLPSATFAEPENVPLINITTVPEKVLFNMENYAPGDWTERVITLENLGGKSTYSMEIKHKSGSEKLFEMFNLTIENNGKEIFNGKISEFKGVTNKGINAETSHEYFLLINFPYESGNEFQGLKTQFELIFKAVGNEAVSTPDQSSVLPNTAGTAYNYIFYGLLMLGIGIIVFYSQKIKNTLGE